MIAHYLIQAAKRSSAKLVYRHDKNLEISWRAVDFCPLMCEEYNPKSDNDGDDFDEENCLFHHEYCIPVCFDTCNHRRELAKIQTLEEYDEFMINCERPACYEGCAPRCCDEEVYDERTNSCVPHADCPRPKFHPNYTDPDLTTIFERKTSAVSATTMKQHRKLHKTKN